ncbi:MAG: hypothetical protein Q4D55_07050 [Eubacteriales bacterium]|nr:hypothetical protein [Eubacteriales bacterium]
MEQKQNQDLLTGALIGLAKTCESNPKTEDTDQLLVKGLWMTAQEDMGEQALLEMTEKIREEKYQVSPGCRHCESPCGNTSDCDMSTIWKAEPMVRQGKIKLLLGIRRMALQALPQLEAGELSEETIRFLHKGLAVLGYEMEAEDLAPTLAELDEKLALL